MQDYWFTWSSRCIQRYRNPTLIAELGKHQHCVCVNSLLSFLAISRELKAEGCPATSESSVWSGQVKRGVEGKDGGNVVRRAWELDSDHWFILYRDHKMSGLSINAYWLNPVRRQISLIFRQPLPTAPLSILLQSSFSGSRSLTGE